MYIYMYCIILYYIGAGALYGDYTVHYKATCSTHRTPHVAFSNM